MIVHGSFLFVNWTIRIGYLSYCVRVLLFRDGKNAEIVSFLDIHDRKPVYTAPVYLVHGKNRYLSYDY
jgi:hypothetical protein